MNPLQSPFVTQLPVTDAAPTSAPSPPHPRLRPVALLPTETACGGRGGESARVGHPPPPCQLSDGATSCTPRGHTARAIVDTTPLPCGGATAPRSCPAQLDHRLMASPRAHTTAASAPSSAVRDRLPPLPRQPSTAESSTTIHRVPDPALARVDETTSCATSPSAAGPSQSRVAPCLTRASVPHPSSSTTSGGVSSSEVRRQPTSSSSVQPPPPLLLPLPPSMALSSTAAVAPSGAICTSRGRGSNRHMSEDGNGTGGRSSLSSFGVPAVSSILVMNSQLTSATVNTVTGGVAPHPSGTTSSVGPHRRKGTYFLRALDEDTAVGPSTELPTSPSAAERRRGGARGSREDSGGHGSNSLNSSGNGQSRGVGQQERGTEGTMTRPRCMHVRVAHQALLGKGRFGIVVQAIDLDTNRILAVKEISLDSFAPPSGAVVTEKMYHDYFDLDDDDNARVEATLSGEGGNDVEVQRHLVAVRRELQLMRQLDHPNIVRYLGSDVSDGCLRIFMEYVAGGSISRLLKLFGPFAEEQAANFTEHVVHGLAYLHARHIVHRDLKGDNLLVDPDTGVVKLADFGTARSMPVLPSPDDIVGTAYFIAPEILNKEPASAAADVWSLGCCVIEMLTGRPPLSEQKNSYSVMVYVANFAGDLCAEYIPAHHTWSREAVNFIQRCLRRHAPDRPTAHELLHHPWLVAARRRREWGRVTHTDSSSGSVGLPLSAPLSTPTTTAMVRGVGSSEGQSSAGATSRRCGSPEPDLCVSDHDEYLDLTYNFMRSVAPQAELDRGEGVEPGLGGRQRRRRGTSRDAHHHHHNPRTHSGRRRRRPPHALDSPATKCEGGVVTTHNGVVPDSVPKADPGVTWNAYTSDFLSAFVPEPSAVRGHAKGVSGAHETRSPTRSPFTMSLYKLSPASPGGGSGLFGTYPHPSGNVGPSGEHSFLEPVPSPGRRTRALSILTPVFTPLLARTGVDSELVDPARNASTRSLHAELPRAPAHLTRSSLVPDALHGGTVAVSTADAGTRDATGLDVQRCAS